MSYRFYTEQQLNQQRAEREARALIRSASSQPNILQRVAGAVGLIAQPDLVQQVHVGDEQGVPIVEQAVPIVEQAVALEEMATSWKDFAPECYTGKMSINHPVRIKHWKKGMETAVSLAYPNLDKAQTKSALRKLLSINSRESALRYIQEVPDEKTCDEACEMLGTRFEGDKEKSKALEKLLDGTKQLKGEDIDAFYTKWKSVYDLTGLNLDASFKIVFFKRCLEAVVRNDIAGERPLSIDSLLSTIRNRAIDGRYGKELEEKKILNPTPGNGDKLKSGNGKQKFDGECNCAG